MCSQNDEKWMQIALLEARDAAAAGEIPVGAVIVKDGEVIARAHNRCEEWKDATAHAECIAIAEAGRKIGSWRLSDCTLYVTLEPCPMCTGAAINARVSRVVYAAKDPRAGACESLVRLPSYPLECRPVCESGACEDEARELLRDFFSGRRSR